MLEGTFPADQCDCCRERGLAVIAPALGAKPEEGGSIRVYYRCRDDGYQWWTSYTAGRNGRLTRNFSMASPQRPAPCWWWEAV